MEDAFTARLSEYLDDEDLDARERREIDEHLRACAACRLVLDDLREVRAHARALPDVPPVADLWPGIEEQIGGQIGARSFSSASTFRDARLKPRAPGAARKISFTIPQAIAASLALMVVSGGMVWLLRAGGEQTDRGVVAVERPRAPEMTPANFADPQYDQAVADLERTLEVGEPAGDRSGDRAESAGARSGPGQHVPERAPGDGASAETDAPAARQRARHRRKLELTN